MNDKLLLHTRTVGPWGANAFALICPRTSESVLIDPGGNPDQLVGMLANSKPTAILVTHSHPDHIGALPRMQQWLKVPVMAHRGDTTRPAQIAADRWLADCERVEIGRHWLSVRHTPGHCADQVCFLLGDSRRAIVGDTIFEGGPGKTWSSSDFRTTLVTLSEKILSWHDDTICHPGHGPSFRLGDLRGAIESFVRTDHGEFFGDATWGMQ